MPTPTIAIITEDSSCLAQAIELSQSLQLPIIDHYPSNLDYVLIVSASHLKLKSLKTKTRPIYIDFLTGNLAYRREHGGGRQQLIARAVGLKAHYSPTVIDATAGLGEDGFILATLGCQLTLIERSPIIAALLADALARANHHPDFHNLKINLMKTDAITYLQTLKEAEFPDVIYLDPMFPSRTKSALVKKEMRILRDLVGDDIDATMLLETALTRANKRVVVKRPRLAAAIPGPLSSISYNGKSCRFDVYLISRNKSIC